MFPKASATFPSRLNRPPWLRNGFLVTQKLEKIFIPTVEQVPVNALKSDGQNPNRMTATQTQSLLVGIQRYGFLLPIVTNKDLLIADGEQRWDIAKRLGMAVYDPFGGSGTTLVACEKSKRRCFMMETEPRYVDVILRRYTYTTNQEPKKL